MLPGISESPETPRTRPTPTATGWAAAQQRGEEVARRYKGPPISLGAVFYPKRRRGGEVKRGGDVTGNVGAAVVESRMLRLKLPMNVEKARCCRRSQTVYHGPVVYADDPYSRVESASSGPRGLRCCASS